MIPWACAPCYRAWWDKRHENDCPCPCHTGPLGKEKEPRPDPELAETPGR